MLVVIGPQGAGNHLWSKVLSLHPAVYGWKTLLDNYWEAHRFAEPFAACWKNHSLLAQFNWEQADYYFTSISCPLGIPGHDVNPIWQPDVAGFIAAVEAQGVQVQVAVIGRDQNILNYQQTRVRGEPTLPLFLEQLAKVNNPIFLSYELLYLYRSKYLQSLQLNIPLAINDSRLDEILQEDANARYIQAAGPSLDSCNATGNILKEKP